MSTSTAFVYAGGSGVAVIKASGATTGLYGIDGLSPDSGFLQLFNKASAPVVGTDTPVATLPIIGRQPFSFQFEEAMGGFTSAGIAFALSRYPVFDTNIIANDMAATFRVA